MRDTIFHDFLFPSHVVGSYNKNFKQYKNQLIDYTNHLVGITPPEFGAKGPGSSNAWRSKSMFFKDGSFDFFYDIFREQVAVTANQFGLVDIPLYFSGAWITLNRPGSYLTTHVHSNCLLSGVLWIDTPPDSGDIVFTNSNSWYCPEVFDDIDSSIRNNFNSVAAYFYPPVEGKMIIFPGYLPHCVKENKSEKNRISITFNLSQHENSFPIYISKEA